MMDQAKWRNQTCCFTGHRNIPAEQESEIIQRTMRTIRTLILEKGVRFFGVGGAVGYDTLAAESLFWIKEHEFPQIESYWCIHSKDLRSDGQKGKKRAITNCSVNMTRLFVRGIFPVRKLIKNATDIWWTILPIVSAIAQETSAERHIQFDTQENRE